MDLWFSLTTGLHSLCTKLCETPIPDDGTPSLNQRSTREGRSPKEGRFCGLTGGRDVASSLLDEVSEVFEKLGFASSANHPLCDFAIVEDNERWNAEYLVALSQFASFVDIDLGD